jgi:hypothetical protein
VDASAQPGARGQGDLASLTSGLVFDLVLLALGGFALLVVLILWLEVAWRIWTGR